MRPAARAAAGWEGVWAQWVGWLGETVSGLSSLWAAASERQEPEGPAPNELGDDSTGSNPDYAAGIDPNGEH